MAAAAAGWGDFPFAAAAAAVAPAFERAGGAVAAAAAAFRPGGAAADLGLHSDSDTGSEKRSPQNDFSMGSSCESVTPGWSSGQSNRSDADGKHILSSVDQRSAAGSDPAQLTDGSG
eukprot:TRINITY_DN13982_c0_g1_i1.p1 TRINITY_DN13982_c0_g1~~TRINITY_DN13982_c0_g1_i1.p1  ORF type:complete len:117 (+),score=19.08 TRINITY_DN13982_c0_g1_i1:87-437(+)